MSFLTMISAFAITKTHRLAGFHSFNSSLSLAVADELFKISVTIFQNRKKVL